MKETLFLFALFTGLTHAQDLKDHRWKNRLVIVYSDHFENTLAKEQISELNAHPKALKDRKIALYHITPAGYRVYGSDKVFALDRTFDIEIPFEVQLVGLDGGVKFSSREVEPVETFNSLIDDMPMRKTELKERNGQ